jgi:hypothetical protein
LLIIEGGFRASKGSSECSVSLEDISCSFQLPGVFSDAFDSFTMILVSQITSLCFTLPEVLVSNHSLPGVLNNVFHSFMTHVIEEIISGYFTLLEVFFHSFWP